MSTGWVAPGTGEPPQGDTSDPKTTKPKRKPTAAQISARAKHLKPFPPGQSGNPGGRPSTRWIRDYLGESIGGKDGRPLMTRRQAYMTALFTTAMDRRHRDHVRAALGLMAYDFGKPSQEVVLTGKDGGPVETLDRTPDSMTTEQRVVRMRELLKKAGGAIVSTMAEIDSVAENGSEPADRSRTG